VAKEFERELSFVRQKSIGKKEQGSLIIIKKPVTFTGKISSKTQSEFEDKLMVIEGDDVKREHLLDHGLWVSCKKGLKPESPNQDDFVVVIEDSSILLGVFDGHGTHGHEISNFLHKVFPRTLVNSTYWDERPDYALAEAFPSVHNELVSYCCKNSELFDCTLSGSTATVIYTRDKKIYAGHTGDSRAVLGKRVKGKITAVDLTRDHKPTLDDENERINRMGGEVRRLDDDIPYRVFFKGKHYPGIAMSRTIGDQLAQTVGVTCIPDVSVFDIEENDEFIVACSDGVWEFISSQEAVEEISKHSNPRIAAENLATLAWNKWITNEEDVVDDITVVLAYLKKKN
jgi:serine/threonine protein phosphatase PrpC